MGTGLTLRANRVAALYDIHGNLPALDAVLMEVGRIGVDCIVIGGDVLPGPMPNEVLRRLQNVGTPVVSIFGNGEIAVLDEIAGRTPRVPAATRPIISWNADQLAPEFRSEIARWPLLARVEIGELGAVTFCHATPENENDIFVRTTPEEAVAPLLSRVSDGTLVCGHTHMQFDRYVAGKRVVNAGSVGMPFGPPGADWLLLGPSVEFRRSAYDRLAAADMVRATRYPERDHFALNNILQPASADDMLQAFERVDISRRTET